MPLKTRIRLPPPRLLTLDAFETIYSPNPSVPEQYSTLHHKFFPSTPPLVPSAIATAFYTAFKARAKSHANYKGGEQEWWFAVIRSTFTLAGGDVSGEVGDAFVNALFERFNGGIAYKLMPDITVFLDSVPKETRVGVLSNSDTRCREVLRSIGVLAGDESSGDQDGIVGHAWVEKNEDVVLSCEVGVEKPDPKMFKAAESLVSHDVGLSINLVPGDAVTVASKRLYWHIGDEVRKDVVGILNNTSELPHWGAIYVRRTQGLETSPGGDVTLRHGGRVIEVGDLRDLLGLWSTGIDVVIE
ncbi:hypothetical protein V1512DRAFT_145928 [Lipomyces arxii]|uniref:uncharacterized protein n=1 Tax=Lipomyces arxii TaxID=56418 RepID=UPI0034CE5CBD